MKIIAVTEPFLERVIDAKKKFLQKSLKHWPSWITADHLTFLRILCTVPVIFFFLNKRPDIAFWFFISGAFTDFLDGGVAQHQKKETDVGKLLDPIADKILAIFTIVIIFISKGPSFFPPLLFSLILLFESILLLMGGKAMQAQTGIKKRLGANSWGKWKFFFQAIGISLLLLQRPFLAQINLWISVPFAISSIIGHLAFKAEPE